MSQVQALPSQLVPVAVVCARHPDLVFAPFIPVVCTAPTTASHPSSCPTVAASAYTPPPTVAVRRHSSHHRRSCSFPFYSMVSCEAAPAMTLLFQSMLCTQRLRHARRWHCCHTCHHCDFLLNLHYHDLRSTTSLTSAMAKAVTCNSRSSNCNSEIIISTTKTNY